MYDMIWQITVGSQSEQWWGNEMNQNNYRQTDVNGKYLLNYIIHLLFLFLIWPLFISLTCYMFTCNFGGNIQNKIKNPKIIIIHKR